MIVKKRMLNLAKEGYWIIISQLFSIVGSFYYIKLITNKLEPSLYGTVALILSISIFFSQVIYGGVGSAVSRFFSIAENQSDLRRYFESSKKIVLRLSIFLILFGGIPVIILLTIGYRNLFILTIFTLFISIINGLISILSNFQNAARDRVVVAINNGLGVVLKIGIAIFLFNLFGANEMTLVFSLLLASSITLFSQLFFLRKKLKSLLQIDNSSKSVYNWHKQIWTYARSVILWSGFMALYQLSDKWALEYYNSSKEVGVYNVFFQLGYGPTLLVMSNLLAFISPVIYQRAGDGKDQVKNKYVHR
jgi:O-antigen/teichoic acid export membrane protein